MLAGKAPSGASPQTHLPPSADRSAAAFRWPIRRRKEVAHPRLHQDPTRAWPGEGESTQWASLDNQLRSVKVRRVQTHCHGDPWNSHTPDPAFNAAHSPALGTTQSHCPIAGRASAQSAAQGALLHERVVGRLAVGWGSARERAGPSPLRLPTLGAVRVRTGLGRRSGLRLPRCESRLPANQYLTNGH